MSINMSIKKQQQQHEHHVEIAQEGTAHRKLGRDTDEKFKVL